MISLSCSAAAKSGGPSNRFTLADLRETPAFALLAEPGMGKITAFKQEASSSGTKARKIGMPLRSTTNSAGTRFSPTFDTFCRTNWLHSEKATTQTAGAPTSRSFAATSMSQLKSRNTSTATCGLRPETCSTPDTLRIPRQVDTVYFWRSGLEARLNSRIRRHREHFLGPRRNSSNDY